MNALDLRFEPETFDVVFCLSSIEHFGGDTAARHASAEMHRVAKPGGVVAITTECLINDDPELDLPGLLFFSQKSLQGLAESVPGLELVEPIDFQIGEETRKSSQSLAQAIADVQSRGVKKFPHIVLSAREDCTLRWRCSSARPGRRRRSALADRRALTAGITGNFCGQSIGRAWAAIPTMWGSCSTTS